ncbi:MAG: WD40 repeat domain-containing protein [Sandaracinaceae bacterium]|nr:WD40 repeat domain-containing protein [Sandaracinaceae bacterium]
MDDLRYRYRGDAADYATCLAVSVDGAHVAVGNGAGGLTVLDGTTGALRFGREMHVEGVQAIDLAAGLGVSGGNDGKARLWDASTGVERAVIEGEPRAWVEHLSFAPDGKLFAMASGKVLRFVDATGQLLHRIEAAPATIAGMAWNKKGTELAIASYGALRTYRPATGARAKYLAWKGSLISIAWSPDEKVVACGTQDCAVHFWRLATANDSEMSGYPGKPKALAWDASGTLLATGGDATGIVWTFTGKGPEGTTPIQLAGHGKPITKLAFHPRKGLLASASQDGSIFVWEPKKSNKPLAFASMPAEVTGLAWRGTTTDLVASDAEGGIACFME